jgi:hypothetical protein
MPALIRNRRSSAVFGLLLFTACGSGDPVSPPPPPPPPPPPVATVEVQAPSTALEAGKTLALTATAKDAAGATLSGVNVSWTTSAPTIATVDNSGLVRGVAAGSATITASASGRSGAVALVVRDTTTLGTTFGGRIERLSLTLPAGTTHRVEQDLVLVIDSTLTIAGRLEVAAGVSVALFAHRIVVSGDISTPAAAGATRAAAGQSTGSRLRATLGTFVSTGLDQLFETTVHFEGPMYFNGRSGLGLPSRIEVRGRIAALDAPNGTASDRDGLDGFPVEIGTVAARAAAPAGGFPPGPVSQVVVATGALIAAGRGGYGFTIQERSDGVSTANVLFAQTGDGGPGGDLVIEAATLANDGTLRAGDGGGAGIIGAESSVDDLTNPVALASGSGPAGEGESIEAIIGAGGDAGRLTINAPSTTNRGRIAEGHGGGAGAAYLGGGNGGPGGSGGFADIEFRGPGARGIVTVPSGVVVVPPSAAFGGLVQLVTAFNGGGSASPARPGGDGGPIAVRWGTPAADRRVVSFASASGGQGWIGCPPAALSPGSNGGRGGEIDADDVDPEFDSRSLNGGHGGAGFYRVGKGGQRGQKRILGTVTPVGFAGSDGANCGPAGLQVNPTGIDIQIINSGTSCGPLSTNVRFENRTPILINVTGTINSSVGNLQMRFSNGATTTELAIPPLTTVVEPVGGTSCLTNNDNQGTIEFKMLDAVSGEDDPIVIANIPTRVRCIGGPGGCFGAALVARRERASAQPR